MFAFHSSPYESPETAAEGAIKALTHLASFQARFTGQDFEVREPLRLKFYSKSAIRGFREALEDLIEGDPERFPIGGVVTEAQEDDRFFLVSTAVRTKSNGHDYIVHVIGERVEP